MKYLNHAWQVEQKSSISESDKGRLNDKLKIIKDLYYAKNLDAAKKILSDRHNQSILNTNRTSVAAFILKAIGALVTLPISAPTLLYKGLKRDSFNFFKPHSQIFGEQAGAEISKAAVRG